MSSPFFFFFVFLFSPCAFGPWGKLALGGRGVTGFFYYGVVIILDSGSVKGLYTTDPFHGPKPNFVKRKSHKTKIPPPSESGPGA